jgi:hypothetical protein
MITQITHLHFCNLGALNNKNCFSRLCPIRKELLYYYHGNLSQACWAGAGINPMS